MDASPAPLHILGLGLPWREPRDGTADFQHPNPALLHPVLSRAEVLIGGKAQLTLLPNHSAKRLVVTADIPALLDRMAVNRREGKEQVVLCSGDPLFFGLGARLREYFGPEGINVLPGISSLQGAAAMARIPWENIRSVSLHGRSSHLPLAHALLTRDPIFLIPGSESSPATVARYMMERGGFAYIMHVLDNLHMSVYSGNVHADRHDTLTMKEALHWQVSEETRPARVLLLEPQGRAYRAQRPATLAEQTATKHSAAGQPIAGQSAHSAPPLTAAARETIRYGFGLPDPLILRENNLFTKSPVRAAGLAALGIAPHHTVWDLGAGSGAVALEAAFLAYQGHVIAVEKDRGRVSAIAKNRLRFGAATLDIVHGRLPECLLPEPAPGSVTSASVEFSHLNVEDADDITSAFADAHTLFHTCEMPLPRPHRVFLGGGLGGAPKDAARTLESVWQALLPGGRLVVHCVLLESLERVRAFLRARDIEHEIMSISASHSKPLGNSVYLEGMNPVFLVTAQKPEEANHTEARS